MRNCPERVYFLIIIVWSFSFELMQAQNLPIGLPEIKNYTPKDYQWHPKNFQITQGNNKLIYVGNSYGVLEFDGKMWKKILLPSGLDGHTLYSPSNNQILVGSYNQFGQISLMENGATQYDALVDIKNGIGTINGIWTTVYETLVATNKAIFEYKNHELHLIFNLPKGLSFVQVSNRKLYYQSNDIFTIFDLAHRQLRKQIELNQKIVGLIDSFLITNDGQLLSVEAESTPTINQLPKGFEINKTLQLKSGQFVLTSPNHGLVILDKNLNFVHHISSKQGLLSDNIFDLHEDHEGNLWLALDNGISHITLNTPFTHFGRSNGIRGMGYASAIFQDRLYLGTSQGAFVHKKQNEFELINDTEGQVYEFRVLNNRLLIAHEDGLLELKKGKIKTVYSKQKVWTIREIPEPSQELILGTEKGLMIISPDDTDNFSFKSINGFNESSRVIEFDSKGQLWVCHGNKGLYRLSIDYENMNVNQTHFFAQKSIHLPTYISFVSQSEKGLLFSGEDGVYQFDMANNTFIPSTKINSFLQHNFYVDKIIEDSFMNLWIIQDNKITKLDPLDNGSYTLLPENVITELNGNLVGSYEYLHVYDSNNVVIGTQEGFAHFNVNANINYRLKNQDKESKTIIREVNFEQTDSSWLAPLEPRKKITLPHDFNNVTFTYAAGYYQSRDQIKFSFYLEDEDGLSTPYWSDWHESNQNSFKNLAPGQYTFHIRSRGDLFKYSEPTSYQFTIQSPWYTTKLSIIAYTLIIICIGIVIYKIRVTKLKQEKRDAILKKDEEIQQQKLLAETEKIKLINERLKEKVLLKNKELGSVALEITRKNEFLGQLKKGLNQIASSSSKDAEYKLKRSIRSIDQNMRSDKNWERFEMYFDESHQDFIKKLKEKQPDLTKSSINLCAFIKLDLSTKEIASLMNISVSGVEKRRYRLRKKMNLESDTNLKAYLESI